MGHIVFYFFVFKIPTNQPLEGEDGVSRVDNSLTLSGQANKAFTVFCKSDNGGSSSCAFRILNHSGSLALHDGDAGICRSQVNADNRALTEATQCQRCLGK